MLFYYMKNTKLKLVNRTSIYNGTKYRSIKSITADRKIYRFANIEKSIDRVNLKAKSDLNITRKLFARILARSYIQIQTSATDRQQW